jgi:hypothetical protein
MEQVKLEQKPSSIFPNGQFEQIKSSYLMMPTWLLVVVLIFAFFILKSFIYLADEKRKGK